MGRRLVLFRDVEGEVVLLGREVVLLGREVVLLGREVVLLRRRVVPLRRGVVLLGQEAVLLARGIMVIPWNGQDDEEVFILWTYFFLCYKLESQSLQARLELDSWTARVTQKHEEGAIYHVVRYE